jgi:hypothetical protein
VTATALPFATLSLLLLPNVVSAATIVVDDSGGQDYTRIQAAINAASNGDVIQVRAGSYGEALSIVGKSLTIQGASSATVQVQASGSSVLSIDGGGTVSVSGLQLSGGERGLTVREGTSSFSDLLIQGNNTAGNGGGVGVFDGADVTMSDCVVTANEATSPYHGGGVYVSGASLLMERCDLSANQAVQGGAIYIETGALELVDCTISGNTASSHGGAVRLRDGATVVASGTTLEGNSASGRGGAVSIEDSDSDWTSCSFIDNVASTGGGALHLSGQGSTGSTVDGTLQGNIANGAGGAIWAWDHDLVVSGELLDNVSPDTESGGAIYAAALRLQLLGVDISGHSAANGGGVYATSGTTVFLSGSTVSGNEALVNGGGLYSMGALTMVASFIDDNLAGGEGGGLYHSDAAASISSSRMMGNQAGGAGGGALLRSASLELSGSAFRQNSAAQGAGLCVIGGGGSVLATISGSEFTDNISDGSGGGLYADSLQSLALTTSELSGNSSGAWGGGLYALGVDWAGLRELDLSSNSALQGGGMYLASMTGNAVELEITANSATGSGGGGVLSAPSGSFTLRNSRVLENEAFEGGGLLLSSDAGGSLSLLNLDVVANDGGGVQLDSATGSSVVNSILVGNSGVGLSGDTAAHSGALAYNLVWSNDSDWGGKLGDRVGQDGNISDPPQYAAWSNDGNPANEVLLLSSASPARDAGDPTLLDLDGSRSDMGSYGGPSATDGDADGDGWARSQGDCDDAEAAANPGASEQVYDGVDNDCDPATLDDDLDGDGFDHELDCDDGDPSINPDADDPFGDGVDQDCDGADGVAPDDTGAVVDTETPQDTGVPGEDRDHDGYTYPEDCNDQEPDVNPGMEEQCDDGFDNDCDGAVDASDADCLGDRDTDCLGCASTGTRSGAVWFMALLGLVGLRRRGGSLNAR